MIGIIYVGDVGIAPYAKKYTDTFSKNNIDYEIIQWDRDGNNGKYDDNVHTFSCTIHQTQMQLRHTR